VSSKLTKDTTTDAGPLVFGLLVLGLLAFILLRRNPSNLVSQVAPNRLYQPASANRVTLTARAAVALPDMPQENSSPPTAGLVKYKNTETRELEWDYEHMVPTKITIHRESLQMP